MTTTWGGKDVGEEERGGGDGGEQELMARCEGAELLECGVRGGSGGEIEESWQRGC